jgi:hypothetical protein
MSIYARTAMQKVIMPDYLCGWVGKKSKRIASLSAQLGGHLGRVYAYCHRSDTQILESRQLFFNTP